MSEASVSLLSAIAGALLTLALWVIDRYGLRWMTRSGRADRLTGQWAGWSVYLPVDGFYSRDSEAIYRTLVDIKQTGHRVVLRETLPAIYDIAGNHLTALAKREFLGHGKVIGQFDIAATFKEKGGLTLGSMQIVIDWRANELIGVLAVRPQIPGRPVAVKILLRRTSEPMPTWDDLGVPLVQALAAEQARRTDP